MGEREPRKEAIQRGELFYLWHPGSEDLFSGYGLNIEPDQPGHLVGLLMVDRPYPVDSHWLEKVKAAYGDYQLVPMTVTGERGIVCRMVIDSESTPFLRQLPLPQSRAVRQRLKPLLWQPLAPAFTMQWSETEQLWQSQLIHRRPLPPQIREVFAHAEHGCLLVDTNIGVTHLCRLADQAIERVYRKPIKYQWQLIKTPSASLIRLEVIMFSSVANPERLETFFDVRENAHLDVLGRLSVQDALHLSFYGDDDAHWFTETITQDKGQQERLDAIVFEALAFEDELPVAPRDYEHAKRSFMQGGVQYNDPRGWSPAVLPHIDWT